MKPQHHMFAAKSTNSTLVFPLLALIGFIGVSSVKSQPDGYTYTKIAALGETAAGGIQYFFDFEPGQINNRGDVIYVADLSPNGVDDIGEGVFLLSHGQILALSLPEQSAPGGGTFAGAAYSPAGVNDGGDGAAAIQLEPFGNSSGENAGLYRYSANKNSLSAVVLPNDTKVPGTESKFQGILFGTSINNRGDICFTGLINTNVPLPGTVVIGKGVFVIDKKGNIRKVAMPGDLAPFGKVFDFVEVAWINDLGDVGFGAHVQGEEFLQDNVYLSKAPSFQIISIAHQGEPAPGGGMFRHAWGPILNNSHQVLFVGDLTPAPAPRDSLQGLYLYNGSFTVPVVLPRDTLPDGKMKTVSDYIQGHHLNNPGEISFLALLDTGDEAIYVKSGSTFRLVAKTGTTIPNVGTITDFDTFGVDQYGRPSLSGGAINNDRGQVIFSANLVGGSQALIVATPLHGR